MLNKFLIKKNECKIFFIGLISLVFFLSCYLPNEDRAVFIDSLSEKDKREDDQTSTAEFERINEKLADDRILHEDIQAKTTSQSETKQIDTVKKELKVKRDYLEEQKQFMIDPSIPWVIGITTILERYTEKVDLVRLYHALQYVANFHWIVVEDATHKTSLIKNVLLESKIGFTHLNIRTPMKLRGKEGERYNHHSVAQKLGKRR